MPRRPLTALAALAAVALLVPAAPAGGQQDRRPGLTLASQTAWVRPGGEFGLRVAVDAAGQRSDLELAVTVHRAVTSRSQFQRTLDDRVATSVIEATSTPLTELVPDAAGAIVVRLPVQDPAAPRDPARLSLRGPGVYPVSVELGEEGGGRVVAGFTTHLVLVPASVDGPLLQAAFVVPVHAAPALQPDGTRRLASEESAEVAVVATELEQHPSIGLTLAPTPETLQALSVSARAIDRDSLARLAEAASSGARQVLGGPYVAVPPTIYTPPLASEGTAQLTVGTDVLTEALDVRPDPGVRVVDGPLTNAIVAAFRAQQVDRLVVEEEALEPVSLQLTLAQPFQLGAQRGRAVEAMMADAGLTEHFTDQDDPVLAAHHLLADLAVIYYDSPGLARGVVIVPPGGWRPQASLLGTVLSGLGSSPVLEGATLDEAFSVPEATTSRGNPLVRTLDDARSPRLPARAIQAGRARLDAFSSLLEPGEPVYERLHQTLLVSEAARLSPGRRTEYLDGLGDQINEELERVRGPSNLSITLTAREGRIPVTVHSDAPYPVRVQVKLESDQLRFPGGSTRQLALTRPNTTERFTVQARTSGAFPLVVRLESPDGRLVLDSSRFTIRSTAASGVGIVLSVGAGSFLLLWWASHAIGRRRAAARERHPSAPPS